MKNTLIIAFNAGAYGTYLEWVLNSLLNDQPLQLPFTELGNSHASKLGHNLLDMTGFQRYLASNHDFVTAKLHPKTKKTHSLRKNLEHILDHVPSLILLYPDRSHELMCIGNYMTKIWSEHAYKNAWKDLDPNDIYKNWNIDPKTDLCEIPVWIQREHMSFYLFDAWRDQVEWYFPDRWQHPRAMILSTKELFDDFENTLIRIRDFWGQEYKKNLSEMMDAHAKMIKIQPHLNKDQMCAKIVNIAIGLDQSMIEFGNIDLTGQAWIQHQLRNNGYELKCHDLNDFPTDTHCLKSLIYRSSKSTLPTAG